MAFKAVAKITPQYEDNPNWWLKFFIQGTVTPLVMATDAAAGTQLAKAELNVDGFPITAGSAMFIPFVDDGQNYDVWLFPTAAEADANDTSNALQFAENLNSADDTTAAAIAAAAAAEASAAEAAADVVLTNADAVATAADEANTDADAIATAADAVSTDADATAAALSLFDFTEIYLGAYASAPALTPNGNAIADGMIYTNTTSNGIFYRVNAAWVLQSAMGTAALADTGTGAANVPTITQADARYLTGSLTNIYDDATGTTTAISISASGEGWYIFEGFGSASTARGARSSGAAYYNPNVLRSGSGIGIFGVNDVNVDIISGSAQIISAAVAWYINRIDKIN